MSSEIITKNDLKAILNEVLPSTSVDYIVEEGTDNGWTYRKYANRTFDAWYRKSFNVARNTAWGSWHRSADQTINLPSFVSTYSITGSINGREMISFLTFRANYIVFNIVRPDSTTASARDVCLHLHGTY